MEITLVKKISSKLMVGNVSKVKSGELYSVIGSASRIKTGTSNYGEWVCLIGEFHAWNDKVNVKSNQLFLPEIAYLPIMNAIDQGAKTVEFGLIIMKKENDSAIGYEYEIKSLIPVNESNRLEDLRKKFNDKIKTPDKEVKTRDKEVKTRDKEVKAKNKN